MSIDILPGIGATIYGDLPRLLSRGDTREVIEASDFVTLHTAADAADVEHAAAVRRAGCERVWLAIPANYLSRRALERGIASAVSEAERCARIALDAGAEVFELNGEGASDGLRPGDWTSAPSDPAEARRLGELAVATLEAVTDAFNGRLAVAWTSHDMPGFRLPWEPILSRVDLHSPQHYPAQPQRLVSQRELEARVERSRGRWEALVERGEVEPAMIPWGRRWAPYLQGWGHQTSALVWGLSCAPIARLWAWPGSWSPQGQAALVAARRLRATVGHGPDAVERFQRSRGLTGDGIVGPQTLAALETASCA